MNKKIDSTMSLGEVVTIYPRSVEVFNKYKIDFCCGGRDSLMAALEETDGNTNIIYQELLIGYEEFLTEDVELKNWFKEKPSALIENILNTHHVYAKSMLRTLDEAIFKILKVHYEDYHEELLKVHSLFGALKIELEEHLIKEEENLFPLILKYEQSGDKEVLSEIKKFIIDTELEHDAAGDILKELEKVTRDFTAPDGVCETYKNTYRLLDELEKDIFIHIYKETSLLFEMLKV